MLTDNLPVDIYLFMVLEAINYVSVSALLYCLSFFVLISLPGIKTNHYGFSRK